MHVLYLHGFGSGPLTEKGNRVGARLAGRCTSYAIPDLEGGDFPGLTMDLILARAVAAAAALPDDGRGVLLIGSSLGGYTAALLAARRSIPALRGLVLIAPAFGFVSSFRARLGPQAVAAWRATGCHPFFHYGAQAEVPLGVGFLTSSEGLPDQPDQAEVPVAIIHGRQDETVDHRGSIAYATSRSRVELHLVEGDHRLTEPRHEDLIVWSALDLLGRTAG
jgi:pimeloyl-ACP methyl ester carboxylesterase